MEKDLATHIGYLAGMYFGLSLEKCKELAFEYAVKNYVVVPKSWIKCKKAETQWWLGFKKRQNLSIRASEATSNCNANIGGVTLNVPSACQFSDNSSTLLLSSVPKINILFVTVFVQLFRN